MAPVGEHGGQPFKKEIIMDIETLVGWGIMLAAAFLFLWRMRAQLILLQYHKRRAVLFASVPFIKFAVTLYGVGSILYSIVETAGITAICFFMLHVGYVIVMPWYTLDKTRYGLIGILVTALAVDAIAFLLRWFTLDHPGVSEITAAAWVSLMTAMMVLGIAAIIVSEGKLLNLLAHLQPEYILGGLIILAGAFVVSLVAVYFQARTVQMI
jgi:hypothetical protein